MNNLLDQPQTSENEWGVSSGESLYHDFQDTSQRPLHQQLADFAGLEAQMVHFDAEQKALVAETRKYYVFPRDSSIDRFFRSHRTLPQLLIQAVPHLKEHFGTNTIFNLRAPVDASGSQTLYAVVMWPGPSDEVRSALRGFDENWWFEVIRQAAGNLTFTYELL